MKTFLVLFPLAILTAAISAHANFGAGDLAVLQVGSSTEVLTNTGNTVIINDITTNGVVMASYTVPTNGASALLISGSASSEGNLSLSADGTTLAFAGYHVNIGGTVVLATNNAMIVPRAYATVDASGNFTLQGVMTDQFSGNNVRTATTDGSNNFWLGGAVSGTYYAGKTQPAATIQSVDVNSRVLAIQNSNLYFSVGSGSGTLGIYGFNGIPTAAAAPTLLIGTGSSSSPDNFVFSPSGKIVYIADDSSFSKGGGVQRWDFGTSWTETYALKPETGTKGARSIAVDFSGPNPVIYGVTTETTANQIFKITDTGATAAATTVALAPTGANYVSIQFAPKAAPVVIVRPTLAIASVSGGQAAIKWPASATSFFLQQDTSLENTNWTRVNTNTYPISVSAGTNTITIPVSSNANYFRLISTNN